MNNKIKKLTELRNSMWEPKLENGCEIIIKKSRKKYSDMINASIKDPVTIYSTGGSLDNWTLIHYTDNFGDSGVTSPMIKKNGYYVKSNKSSIKEILGTPLSITDILRMLNKENDDLKRGEWMYAIVEDGDLIKIGSNSKWSATNISFEILKDIKNQSEEVIDKLLELFNIE